MNLDHSRGFSMIEVLVTIVILSVGLLGVAALMVQSQHVEYESYQRGQALLLVEDMAQRIINNRTDVASYVQASAIPDSQTTEDCTALGTPTAVQVDICEWQNGLRGAAYQEAGAALSTHLTNARGCITQVAGLTGVYIVEVVWAGRTSLGAPLTNCGKGEVSDNDGFRRSVTTTVAIPNLAS